MKIVQLKPKDAEHAHKQFRRFAASVPRDIDGYGMVWFKRQPNGTVTVNGAYSCNDPLDTFAVPNLAHEELRSRLMDENK